jgi:hypothetical protein
MIKEPVSWVKALQDFMSEGPHGKKVEISEFKKLTDKDKLDFAKMLRAEGYTLHP